MKICGNRQPLVIFILSLHFYSITFFNKSDRNYVDEQFCYHFYHRFAELLLKICQFFHLDKFASMIGSFAARFGRGVSSGRNFPVEVSDYAQKVSYNWSYNISENIKKLCLTFLQSPSCLLFTIFLQVLTWIYLFQMKIYENRQPLVIVIVSLHVYSIKSIL